MSSAPQGSIYLELFGPVTDPKSTHTQNAILYVWSDEPGALRFIVTVSPSNYVWTPRPDEPRASCYSYAELDPDKAKILRSTLDAFIGDETPAKKDAVDPLEQEIVENIMQVARLESAGAHFEENGHLVTVSPDRVDGTIEHYIMAAKRRATLLLMRRSRTGEGS